MLWFSGVMLGRKCSVGKTASSKTLASPVSRRMWLGNLARNSSRMMSPRDRIRVEVSSRRVRMTGMKRGHCLLIRDSCSSSLAVEFWCGGASECSTHVCLPDCIVKNRYGSMIGKFPRLDRYRLVTQPAMGIMLLLESSLAT